MNIQPITTIIGSSYNLNHITECINMILEKQTFSKLYNKDVLLTKISETNTMNQIYEEINKNLFPQLPYSEFKNMGFSIVFINDMINILYNNTKIDSSKIDEFKLSDSEYVVDNIKNIIDMFYNLDISVQYYCTDIPLPYISLIKIKSNKNNQKNKLDFEYLTSIVNGSFYKKINVEQVVPIDTMDEHYHLEVMSHLDDQQMVIFSTTLEKITELEKESDYNNKEYIIKYIKNMLDFTSKNKNKVAKIYIANKLFKFLLNIKKFLVDNLIFRTTVSNKIKEFQDDKFITEQLGLELSFDFMKTLYNVNKILLEINKN
jgi:hypothetical protein